MTVAEHVLGGIPAAPADLGAAGSAGLYHSPIGLFDFQVDGVARCYWQYTTSKYPATFVIWDTGIGKTHLTLATACMMIEDGLLDHLVVVAEANKISDWALDDTPRFTDLSVGLYAGDPAKRQKMLDDMPQVLVMTYETGRNDICQFKPKSKAVLGPKMLTKALMGKRVLVVFDETSAKLRNRNSALYIAWDYLINRTLRKQKVGTCFASAMTATSVESSPDNHFNLGRLIAPGLAPSVGYYEKTYIAATDIFGRPSKYKNLTPADCEPDVTPLNQVFGPVTLRKRKTDQDVIDQFPSKVENPARVFRLGAQQRDFYDAVIEALRASDIPEMAQFTLLRQIVGHPASLLRSQGKTARTIVETVGEAALLSMEATKVEQMLAWQAEMGQQQTVIFTFFGQSILPHLDTALGQAGYRTVVNHGQMSHADRYAAQNAFKAGDAQIFLSSDAGARGLNLGVGSGLLHYELPVLYSTYVQRSNRIHRIDSKSLYGHASITIDTLVAHDTVEKGVADHMLKRNAWSDAMIDDEAYTEDFDPGAEFLTAEDRKAMMTLARRAAA